MHSASHRIHTPQDLQIACLNPQSHLICTTYCLLMQRCDGASACRCNESHYQPLKGAVECRSCESSRSSDVGATSCSFCREGFFRVDWGSVCTPCGRLSGVTCPRNATIETLALVQGYWRHSMHTVESHRCRRTGDAWTPCAGRLFAGVEGEGYCEPGFHGPRCEVCLDENHYFNSDSARCKECGNVARGVSLALTGMLSVLALAALAAVALTRPALQRWTTLKKMQQTAHSLRSLWHRAGMQCKLKTWASWPRTLDIQSKAYLLGLTFDVHFGAGYWVLFSASPRCLACSTWLSPTDLNTSNSFTTCSSCLASLASSF